MLPNGIILIQSGPMHFWTQCAWTQKYAVQKRKETLTYIYGSAEVIGLMMLAILRPDLRTGEQAKQLQKYAALQGRAMQYINFIRDMQEDQNLAVPTLRKKT